MAIRFVAFAALLVVSLVSIAAEPVPLADFAKHHQFVDAKISPDGKHLAATSIIEGKRVLSFIDLAGGVGVTVHPRDDDEVYEFWWVNDKRVLYSVAQNATILEEPELTGELFAANYDGSGTDTLFGYRASDSRSGSTGSHIQKKESEYAWGSMENTLRDSDDEALIYVRRMNWSHVTSAGGEQLHPEVRRINVKTGINRSIAVSPLARANFLTDNQGAVRFTSGTGNDQKFKVFYRADDKADWELILDESDNSKVATPLGFNRAGDGVYFACAGSKGRGGLCLWDVATRTFKTLWSGTGVIGYEYTFDEQDIFAIRTMPGRVAVTLVHKQAEEARLLAELMGSFPGSDVNFVSASKDGKKVIVQVQSDRDPGSFYLYDADAKKVSFLLSRAEWIKPETLAVMEPFQIRARDGLELHGYLTKPLGQEETKNLPMVVYVHGGPYHVQDGWKYNANVQMLASRGYAVLQVNFRGSGGYGGGFVEAGYGEWGAKMQDDVTDATRWAIEQGVADPKRICIFGGSYGGYAALQGAVREPDMYQCAIGYVGVYDLALMKSRGDIPQSIFGEKYLERALGKDDAVIAQRSPINNLAKLKAKVMLIVGGQDKRVPPVQGESLHNALARRGIDHEWLYQRAEGHGFYNEANVTDMFEKILAFLGRNIGTAAPSANPAAAPSAPAGN
jgi:dipeptidyl aminopeptidase/acylaminoacyl peptidase